MKLYNQSIVRIIFGISIVIKRILLLLNHHPVMWYDLNQRYDLQEFTFIQKKCICEYFE